MAHVSRITVFPIKSFDGMDVPEALLRANGSLQHDREFVFVDAKDVPLNSLHKDRRLYQVRASFDPECRTVHFSMPTVDHAPQPMHFDLLTQAQEASQWMSEALGKKVSLQRDAEKGFGDDHDRAGPTLISQGTLDHLAHATERRDMHRRTRSNIVLDGLPAFGEDQLYNAERFSLGDLKLKDALPCVRCNVVSRDPETGIVNPKFIKRFLAERAQSFANNAHAKAMGATDAGYYVAAMNTLNNVALQGFFVLPTTWLFS